MDAYKLLYDQLNTAEKSHIEWNCRHRGQAAASRNLTCMQAFLPYVWHTLCTLFMSVCTCLPMHHY